MSDPHETEALLGSSQPSGASASAKAAAPSGMGRKDDEGSAVEHVPVRDLTRARNAFFWWTFIAYIGWGIISELYSNLFHDVIDEGNYAKVSNCPAITFESQSSPAHYAITCAGHHTISHPPVHTCFFGRRASVPALPPRRFTGILLQHGGHVDVLGGVLLHLPSRRHAVRCHRPQAYIRTRRGCGLVLGHHHRPGENLPFGCASFALHT